MTIQSRFRAGKVCGGLLRPDVVWFGESLPRDQLEAAVEASAFL